MVPKDKDESDDFEVEAGDDFTDTDLFDPELIAAELESLQNESPKRSASSARAAIEEMIERKRLPAKHAGELHGHPAPRQRIVTASHR